jgi:Asp-tRNA(Asn)/Glu-tRNA(Gln) amidotransferase A subunit family amidase
MDAAQGELYDTPAVELGAMIRRRDVSPVEILQAVLARIAALDGQLHAFLTLDAERAMDTARAAEAAVARGDALGPLHGIPVSIKDLEPTAGLRTTFGSKFYEHNVPDFDGAATERLKAAGAVVLGKTNTPSWGHKDMCDNLLGPPTRNPWNLDRTSGASSGGAGAAVAAGMGPLAHGSDGAGSIRIPSSLCGIYGLKPSIGRVPYWPNADAWGGRAHAGPMARTVRDAALMLSVMAGPDPRDPLSIDAPPEDYVVTYDGALDAMRGLRVAWSVDLGYAPVDPEVRRLTEAGARRFTELGCIVEAVDPGWDNPHEWHALIWCAVNGGRHASRLAERPEWIEPSLRELIERAQRHSAIDLGQALLARTAFYEQARSFMARYDLLLTPTMPCAAWPVERGPEQIEGRPTPTMFDRLPFTYPFNLSGWPAATVPCGFTSEGLPVGLQIVANRHRDSLCLRASAAFEAVQPWAHIRPPLVQGTEGCRDGTDHIPGDAPPVGRQ